jgi:hypothetical protein
MRATLALLCSSVLGAPPAAAQLVEVRVTGQVEFNQVTSGPLSTVPVLSPVELRFQLDSTVFVDSPNFPTRGYPIVPPSFVLDMGPGNLLLPNPLPGGQVPYFVLRNDDPAVDGFFVSTSVDFPVGVPLNLNGSFGAFRLDFGVTYGGATLDSLDLLAAAGSYDFGGLQVFSFTIDDGPFQPVGMVFESLAIVPLAVCSHEQYGLGSGGANTLTLSGTGTPALGQSLDLTVPGLPSAAAFALLATGPADLPLFGGSLLVDPLTQFLFTPLGVVLGTGSLSVPIPPDPVLAGFTVHLQAAALDPTAPEGVALSNGLASTLCQ